MESIIRISVRNLVEFALKSGSIDSGFASMKTAIEGSKGHRAVQKLRTTEHEQYLSEVAVTLTAAGQGISLEIGGRIDGIIVNREDYIIEEIKTTEKQLDFIEEDYNELHWAQALCYAYIYSNEKGLKNIGVQLTYYHRGRKETKSFLKEYTYYALEDYFLNIVSKYIKWAEKISKWNQTRKISIEDIKFPFDTYRAGQRKFAVTVYQTITLGKKLFAKAPTGIGKTIAAIFPAVKAIGEGHISKVFYLTAKTSTRYLAEEAFENLRKQGLCFKTVTITAKEKICPQDKVSCKPEDCPFAEGYYDRIDAAIEDIMDLQNFNRDTVYRYSQKHRVCPFEFSLDLSLFCDGIICDYNYVFDPRVYLKRFFTDVKEDYGFLIDEAHNLVDRAREMYSADISKAKFLALKNEVKNEFPDLKKSLNSINSFFIRLKKELEETNVDSKVSKEPFDEIDLCLEDFIQAAEKLLSKGAKYSFTEKLLELYFESMNYLKTIDSYDEKFVTYIERLGQDLKLKLFCLDPSRLLNQALLRGKGSVLFSATFSPLDYFRSILGGDEEDFKLSVNSPFEQKNLCLLAANNINTKYRAREQSYKKVAAYIKLITASKQGNYFVFFPSYKYLRGVYDVFIQEYPEVATIVQRGDMTEQERADFLLKFEKTDTAKAKDKPKVQMKVSVKDIGNESPISANSIVSLAQVHDEIEAEVETSYESFWKDEIADGNFTKDVVSSAIVGFAVLGGAFGEGIDLTGDKLIGAIIVGVGLPQICLERDIIKEHFTENSGKGFEYAYVYPGMNKVLQAAGRVIRTEHDKGVVFLIDERFSRNDYRSLMPPEWNNIHWVKNLNMIEEELEKFWRII